MLTGIVMILVALLPGALLSFAVPAGVHRWVTLAGAPVLTLGLASAGMAWLHTVGLPNSAQAVFVFEIATAVAAIAVSQVMRHRAQSTAAPEPDVPAADRSGGRWNRLRTHPLAGDTVALLVPAVIAIGFARHLLGRLSYPPGWDAMNHGILTRDILQSSSTSISSACVTGSTHSAVSCTFYPLASDVTWAQGATLSGGHISTAMLAWSEVVGPLALVLAIYAAVRVLGARPVIAGAAAVASIFLGPVWAALITGRPPEAFGPALSVAVAVLILLAVRGAHPVRLGLLAGVGVGGLVMTHTYDVLFAGVLAIAFVLVDARALNLRRLGVGVGAMIGGLAFAIAPFGSAIAGASSERNSAIAAPRFVGRIPAAIDFWLLKLQRYVEFGYPGPDAVHPSHSLPVKLSLIIAVGCLVGSCLCLVFRQLRWARPWFGAWVAWTLIAFWTSISKDPIAAKLAGLWYGLPERERVMTAPLYPVLVVAGAYGLGLGAQWVLAALRSRRSGQTRPAQPSTQLVGSLAAVLVVALLVGLAAVRSSRNALEVALVKAAPQSGHSYPSAFAWLASHTPKGAVVAYARHNEFMTWSYANNGVPLLFGMTATGTAAKRNYAERRAVWNWLVENPGNRPSGCLVEKFNVAYVVVGGRRIPYKIDSITYSKARLAASPNVRLVHVDGTIKVYEVTPAGRTCATTSG